jgi:hypothetical protein
VLHCAATDQRQAVASFACTSTLVPASALVTTHWRAADGRGVKPPMSGKMDEALGVFHRGIPDSRVRQKLSRRLNWVCVAADGYPFAPARILY